jgi:uncharacterized protein YndB with AHSA1/START domain
VLHDLNLHLSNATDGCAYYQKGNLRLQYDFGRLTIPAQIEKDILIDAPVDVVWRVITEPHQMVQWFSEEAEIDMKPGGHGRLVFRSGDSYQLEVEAVEPPHRFAYRWVQPQGSVARPDNSMLVEFTLEPVGDRTRLRVVESGFDTVDWSDEKKARYAERHSDGWQTLLGRLRDYATR